MNCQSNLRQVGLALHNHHDVRKVLPPGGMQTGSNGTVCYTTWAIEILPFIEMQSLYQQYNQSVINNHAKNLFVTTSRVKFYECSSDNLKGKLEEPASGPHDRGSAAGDNRRLWMHGSYRANSGEANPLNGRGFWDTFEPQFWPGNTLNRQFRGPLHGTALSYNGVPTQTGTGAGGQSVVCMGGPERIANITDGTTNSILAGECTFNDVTRRATFWAFTYASYNQSSFLPESRVLNVSYNKCWKPNGVTVGGQGGDNPCKRAWGSNHLTGLNLVFCDGSTKFVSYNTDINVLASLATIEGGESIQLQ